MSLGKLSLKRRSILHKASLFLTMRTVPIRRKIYLMKALKKSLLHLRARIIKETSIGSK